MHSVESLPTQNLKIQKSKSGKKDNDDKLTRMSQQVQPNQNINLTTNIIHQYHMENTPNRSDGDKDDEITNFDLQQQILAELREANAMANESKKNIDKIAKKASQNNSSMKKRGGKNEPGVELSLVDDELSMRGLDGNLNNSTGDHRNSQPKLLAANNNNNNSGKYLSATRNNSNLGSRQGSSFKNIRSLSPHVRASGTSLRGNCDIHPQAGTNGEAREPCARCIEHGRKADGIARFKEKMLALQKSPAKYVTLNIADLEKQLREARGQKQEYTQLNKMHAQDLPFREKRLSKMVSAYNSDKDKEEQLGEEEKASKY